jgi:hypothetical protein
MYFILQPIISVRKHTTSSFVTPSSYFRIEYFFLFFVVVGFRGFAAIIYLYYKSTKTTTFSFSLSFSFSFTFTLSLCNAVAFYWLYVDLSG